MRSRGVVFTLALAASLAAGADSAAEPAPPLLADQCAACHGPDGASAGSIPDIASLNAAVMRAFLQGFRAGEIESTVMGRIARALTDEEIDVLAGHFGGTGNPEAGGQ